ncbi:MAG: VCBS repeat-containing protein [bacterium]|nr:VCBS repeat-containing protein [bacterium]
MLSFFRFFVKLFFIIALGQLAGAQDFDLPGLVTELETRIQQELGTAVGSVYEVRKDTIYLFFLDPSKITLRSRFYIYSAADTASPLTPTAELEITRLSRQFPAGRISRMFKPYPIRKGDRVVSGPEKVAVISLGEEGRIQLISEMLAGQLTASGRYTATASVELSGLWQKRINQLYSTATDTATLASLTLDTVVAQQIFRETDYATILVGHWEHEAASSRIVYQIYRYGGIIHPPVMLTLDKNIPLYQLLFPAVQRLVPPKPEPLVTDDTTAQRIEPLPVVVENTSSEPSLLQLFDRIPFNEQIFGLTAGDIDKDNQAEVVLFTADKMRLFKWNNETLQEKYTLPFGVNLPTARVRDWIRQATIIELWQAVSIHHSGMTKSEVYEWNSNRLKLLTRLDHLALRTLRSPDGKTVVVTADLSPLSNMYSGETIYVMNIDVDGTVNTQTYSVPVNFYTIAGVYSPDSESPLWFLINEDYQLQAYTDTFNLIWTSATTHGNSLSVFRSRDTVANVQIVCSSSSVYGENDTVYMYTWNNGIPQLKLTYPISGSITHLATGDINGDGTTELIIAVDNFESGTIKSTIFIFQLNNS